MTKIKAPPHKGFKLNAKNKGTIVKTGSEKVNTQTIIITKPRDKEIDIVAWNLSELIGNCEVIDATVSIYEDREVLELVVIPGKEGVSTLTTKTGRTTIKHAGRKVGHRQENSDGTVIEIFGEEERVKKDK